MNVKMGISITCRYSAAYATGRELGAESGCLVVDSRGTGKVERRGGGGQWSFRLVRWCRGNSCYE